MHGTYEEGWDDAKEVYDDTGRFFYLKRQLAEAQADAMNRKIERDAAISREDYANRKWSKAAMERDSLRAVVAKAQMWLLGSGYMKCSDREQLWDILTSQPKVLAMDNFMMCPDCNCKSDSDSTCWNCGAGTVDVTAIIIERSGE